MSDMTRRNFMKWLGLGTAAAVIATQVEEDILGAVDPERLVWTPGAKKIIDLGARPLVTPVEAPILTLDDERLADTLFKTRTDEFGNVVGGTVPVPAVTEQDRAKIFGFGRLARTQRLAIVSAGGYGEFTIVDGKLQGGPKALELLRRVDRPFLTDKGRGIHTDEFSAFQENLRAGRIPRQFVREYVPIETDFRKGVDYDEGVLLDDYGDPTTPEEFAKQEAAKKTEEAARVTALPERKRLAHNRPMARDIRNPVGPGTPGDLVESDKPYDYDKEK